MTIQTRRVDKPWGHEQIFAVVEGRYVGKVLTVTSGESLSLQYHQQKDETIALVSGRAELDLGTSAESLRSIALEAAQPRQLSGAQSAHVDREVDVALASPREGRHGCGGRTCRRRDRRHCRRLCRRAYTLFGGMMHMSPVKSTEPIA